MQDLLAPAARALLRRLAGEDAAADRLLREEVTGEEIAEIVARWTGVPVQRLVEGEREKLLKLDALLPVLRAGIHVVLSDVDCVWSSSPLPMFHGEIKGFEDFRHADVIVATDCMIEIGSTFQATLEKLSAANMAVAEALTGVGRFREISDKFHMDVTKLTK